MKITTPISNVNLDGGVHRVLGALPKFNEVSPKRAIVFKNQNLIINSVYYTKLCVAFGKLDGTDAIQSDLGRFERWTHEKIVKFNKTKCKVLHIRQGNHKQKFSLDGDRIKSSPEEKDLVLVDEKLDMTCHCTLASQNTNRVLGCIKRRMTSRADSTAVLHFCETLPGVLNTTLGLPRQEICVPVGVGSGEGH
ncbi:hypothetical protein DUI87_08215 [Hirundo rustica rustica]|uniref:Reverse transcriptase domain-containing protein n=1 Tax=Hirundo rustica rustica TaxID=333673 RepID=A0A3M0KRW0_HIRRU|nr:hypothetical protein DUI87_08215 [Hirundo rustica rustica]